MSAICPPDSPSNAEPVRYGGYYLAGRICGRRRGDLHFVHRGDNPARSGEPAHACHLGDEEPADPPGRLATLSVLAVVVLSVLFWIAFAVGCGLALGWIGQVLVGR